MDKLTGSLMRLAAAFPRDHIPESTITLYRTKLERCDPDVMAAVIERAIESAKNFPTIAELREGYGPELRRWQESRPVSELPMGRSPMPEELKRKIAELHETFDKRASEMDAS